MAGLSERAVVYQAKESDILSGREFYHKGRIEYLPTGYVAAILCEFEGRKATKKCVDQTRERVCWFRTRKRPLGNLAKPYTFERDPE